MSLYRRRLMQQAHDNTPIDFQDPLAKELCVQYFGGANGTSSSVYATQKVEGIAGEITIAQARVAKTPYISRFSEVTAFPELPLFENLENLPTLTKVSADSITMPRYIKSIDLYRVPKVNKIYIHNPPDHQYTSLSLGNVYRPTPAQVIIEQESPTLYTQQIAHNGRMLYNITPSGQKQLCGTLSIARQDPRTFGRIEIEQGTNHIADQAIPNGFRCTDFICPETLTSVSAHVFISAKIDRIIFRTNEYINLRLSGTLYSVRQTQLYVADQHLDRYRQDRPDLNFQPLSAYTA